MRLRNQLLALFCVLIFAVGGIFYFRTWVVQKPFGIILFLGDGLTPAQITSARIYEGGADYRLSLESFPNVAVLTNYSNDFAVPDSSAAASALATGVKVNNRSLAIDPQGNPLPSILEVARARGRGIGLVTNGSLTDAGVAAFYAHVPNGNDVEAVAAQFLDAKLDVAIGGGAKDFLPEVLGGMRKDRRDLISNLKTNGRTVVRTKAELENAPAFGTSPLVGFFSLGQMAFRSQPDVPPDQPSLADMVRRAIEILQSSQSGYLLVVDAELISRAAEQNNGEYALTEMIELDNAVATAMRYAGEKSLIIVAGKHSTGGMTMNGYPLRQDHAVAVLGKTLAGYPAITWSTGPNGPIVADASPAPPNSEPGAFHAPSAINNASDVLAIGIGKGSEDLKGFLDNTAIFQLLRKQL